MLWGFYGEFRFGHNKTRTKARPWQGPAAGQRRGCLGCVLAWCCMHMTVLPAAGVPHQRLLLHTSLHRGAPFTWLQTAIWVLFIVMCCCIQPCRSVHCCLLSRGAWLPRQACNQHWGQPTAMSLFNETIVALRGHTETDAPWLHACEWSRHGG